MTHAPIASIIVITLNTPGLTRACLRSVVRNTSVSYELIVINNSQAHSIRTCLAEFRGIRVVQNRRNLGFARAANQGALASRGRYLCFLNTDTLVPPRWLERMVEAARQPGVGAVGPTSQLVHGHRLNWPPPNVEPDEEITRFADQAFQRLNASRPELTTDLYGFCLLIPRVVMARIGFFDEGYYFGIEDNDYCIRLRMEGYRLLRLRNLFVHHQGGASSHPNRRRRLVLDARKHFVSKWHPWVPRAPRFYHPIHQALCRRFPAVQKWPIEKKERSASLPVFVRQGFPSGPEKDRRLARLSDLELFQVDKATWNSWKTLCGKNLEPLIHRGFVCRLPPRFAGRPAVTVIMIAHNAAPWIGAAIESVLGQQFRAFELILVEDASTDGTGQIAKRYAEHPQIRILENPWQMGISASRNRAVRQAHGRYLAVCDADDLMMPTHLARFIEWMDHHPEVAWVYSDRLQLNPAGSPIGIDPALAPNGRLEYQHNIIAHAGALIRRKAVEAAGGYDESIFHAEDYDLALRLIRQRARIAALPGEIHYLWRRHPKSASVANPWALHETNRIIRKARRSPLPRHSDPIPSADGLSKNRLDHAATCRR